jgi:hypothetical protein
MASRLTNILQQEYKTKGLIGGAVSALGKSSREKFDIRNIIFGGSGLGSIVGRKVFGKGYSATDRSSKTSEMSSSISGSSSVLQEISINGRITAKNSMALPAMASQMNIMQKNIAKLVKMQGGTPSTKAQNYFSSAKFRENAYEATFNKNAKGTTPTKVEEKKEGGLGGIVGLVASLFVGLASKLGSFVAIITGLVSTFAALGGLLMGTVKLITGLVSMLPGGKLLLKGLKLGALAVGGLFAANALSRGNENADISGQPGERSFLDRAGQAAGGIGGAAAGYMGLKAGSALGNRAPQYEMRQSTIAEKGGKMVKAGDVGSKSMGEKLEKLRKFAVKITSKKQNTLFFKLLGEKVGKAIAFKAVTMFASFAAAPFTAGVSLLITIASAILLGYEIIQIYDAIFGKDGIEESLDALDKAKKNSDSATSPEAMSFEDALIGAFAEALGLNQPTPTSPTPAAPSLPKAGTPEAVSQQSFLGGQQQTYASMSGGEFGPDMLAATGVGADRVNNTSPGSIDPSKTKFADLTREQQDSFMLKQREMEGFKPGSLTYDLNNPGAMLFGPTAEKYGGVLDTTGRGVGTVKGKFASFPTLAAGTEAHRALLLSSGYRNLSLDQAINRWVTGNKDSDIDTNMSPTGQKITNYKSGIYAAIGATSKPTISLDSVSTGAKVAAASTAANRTPAPSSGGNQTTNIIGGGSGNQSVVSASAASPYDTELARLLTQGLSA